MKWRWPWSKPKGTVVHLDAATHNALQQWADERRVSLDDLVRDVLKAVVPSRHATGQAHAGAAILNAAFEALDQDDADVGIPRAVLPVLALMTPAANVCIHLDRLLPSLFREGECAGTCRHHQQIGRPCFWMGTSAHQCPLFRPDQRSS